MSTLNSIKPSAPKGVRRINSVPAVSLIDRPWGQGPVVVGLRVRPMGCDSPLELQGSPEQSLRYIRHVARVEWLLGFGAS